MDKNTDRYAILSLALVISKIAQYYAMITPRISQASEGIGVFSPDIVLARLQLDTFKNMVLYHPTIARPAILSAVWQGVVIAQEAFQGAADRFESVVEKAKMPARSWNTTRVEDTSEFTAHELFDLYGEYFKYLSRVPVMEDVIVPDLPTSLLFDGLTLAPFVYTDLTSPKDTIRLVKMLSISQDLWPPICVSTKTVNFRDGARYATLSYTWSNAHGIFSSEEVAKADTRHDIPISMLGRFPDRACPPEEFWIDAICINQNNDEEKNSQVSVMGDIYTHSQKTWIWLGESDVFSEPALELLFTMGNNTSGQAWTLFRRKASLDPEDFLRELDLPDIFSWKWFAFFAFFQRQWFRRSWVIQEAVLSSQIDVLYGSKTFPWNLLILTSYFLIESDLLHHVQTLGKMEMQTAGLLEWSLFRPVFHSRLDPDLAVFFLPYRITSLKIFDTTIQSKDASTLRPFGDSIDPIAMLLELWRLSRTNLCFDARDKVFAFASLANRDIYRTPNTIATRRQLLPDYGKSVTEVHQEAAWFTLLTHAGLQILSITGHTAHRNIHHLPSWIPDLSQSPRLHGLWQIELEPVKIGWCAAGNSHWKMPPPATLYGRYLMVQVIFVDMVGKVQHPKYRHHNGNHSCSDYTQIAEFFFFEIAPTYIDLNAGRDLYEVVWRTTIANFADGVSPAASEHALQFERACLQELIQTRKKYLAGEIDAAGFTSMISIVEEMKHIGWLRGDWGFIPNTARDGEEETSHLESRACRLIGSGQDGPSGVMASTSEGVEFHDRAGRTLSYRQLFFTALGCVGVGGLDVEFGDSIVVMAGSPVPFVVR
ncbi:hypothetical protein BCON_0173g00020 [Botryotinia convoluta]|uniref:Heterokaryon incompatibility domain-containing protein n=1 Tax=Botryotinia convoluta TaxID=54673 RepID=A0A4Z1I1T9_9HELO|nr:hypothetical protein BCON_0173g00020 [Botryotinia convoluta]